MQASCARDHSGNEHLRPARGGVNFASGFRHVILGGVHCPNDRGQMAQAPIKVGASVMIAGEEGVPDVDRWMAGMRAGGQPAPDRAAPVEVRPVRLGE